MNLVSSLSCPKCGTPVNVVTIGASDSTVCTSCNTSLFWSAKTGLMEVKR